MSVASRKISPAVEEIFSKYNTHKLGGRLKREEALRMFQEEYGVNQIQAIVLFRIFDQDQNDELSAWEFQKFHSLLDKDVSRVLELYDRLSKDTQGHCADISQTFDALIDMKTTSGRSVQEEEAERLVKSAAGSEKFIDLEKFINLMCMVKLLRD